MSQDEYDSTIASARSLFDRTRQDEALGRQAKRDQPLKTAEALCISVPPVAEINVARSSSTLASCGTGVSKPSVNHSL